jgi:pyruvate kinase
MQDIFVATLAMKSEEPAVLTAWGQDVDILRLNATHVRGNREERQARLTFLAKQCAEHLPGTPMAYDTRGRERRLGKMSEVVRLSKGDIFEIGPKPFSVNGHIYLPFTDGKVWDEVQEGYQAVLCDGQIRFVVEEKSADGLVCRVTEGGGQVSSHKSIMFPKIGIDGPALTREDEEDLEFVNAKLPSFTWTFVSFTQRGEDIEQVRAMCRPDMKFVAKPENEVSISYIREQATACDMMMVPRGDLRQAFGRKLPWVTRFIIKEAAAVGTPTFVATGTTTSMVHTLKTLSQGDEAAIWGHLEDGAVGFMESDGTVWGDYPELVPAAVKAAMRGFREHEAAYRQLRKK